ncbi:MAG: hypothetical protein GEU91_18450 [Rhizobiales bacterium]|nr:hypothetical protein [Hyphomicrobiales bacterium]
MPLPRYHTQAEAHALIAQAGGLTELVTKGLAGMLSETESPQLGDIGVIRLSANDVGAIFCDGGIAALRTEPHGTIYLKPATILKAWVV